MIRPQNGQLSISRYPHNPDTFPGSNQLNVSTLSQNQNPSPVMLHQGLGTLYNTGHSVPTHPLRSHTPELPMNMYTPSHNPPLQNVPLLSGMISQLQNPSSRLTHDPGMHHQVPLLSPVMSHTPPISVHVNLFSANNAGTTPVPLNIPSSVPTHVSNQSFEETPPSEEKTKATRGKYKCHTCHGTGHTSRTCPQARVNIPGVHDFPTAAAAAEDRRSQEVPTASNTLSLSGATKKRKMSDAGDSSAHDDSRDSILGTLNRVSNIQISPLSRESDQSPGLHHPHLFTSTPSPTNSTRLSQHSRTPSMMDLLPSLAPRDVAPSPRSNTHTTDTFTSLFSVAPRNISINVGSGGSQKVGGNTPTNAQAIGSPGISPTNAAVSGKTTSSKTGRKAICRLCGVPGHFQKTCPQAISFMPVEDAVLSAVGIREVPATQFVSIRNPNGERNAEEDGRKAPAFCRKCQRYGHFSKTCTFNVLVAATELVERDSSSSDSSSAQISPKSTLVSPMNQGANQASLPLPPGTAADRGVSGSQKMLQATNNPIRDRFLQLIDRLWEQQVEASENMRKMYGTATEHGVPDRTISVHLFPPSLQHWPVRVESKSGRKCKHCQRNSGPDDRRKHLTKWMCRACNTPLCLTCFEPYHSEVFSVNELVNGPQQEEQDDEVYNHPDNCHNGTNLVFHPPQRSYDQTEMNYLDQRLASLRTENLVPHDDSRHLLTTTLPASNQENQLSPKDGPQTAVTGASMTDAAMVMSFNHSHRNQGMFNTDLDRNDFVTLASSQLHVNPNIGNMTVAPHNMAFTNGMNAIIPNGLHTTSNSLMIASMNSPRANNEMNMSSMANPPSEMGISHLQSMNYPTGANTLVMAGVDNLAFGNSTNANDIIGHSNGGGIMPLNPINNINGNW